MNKEELLKENVKLKGYLLALLESFRKLKKEAPDSYVIEMANFYIKSTENELNINENKKDYYKYLKKYANTYNKKEDDK